MPLRLCTLLLSADWSFDLACTLHTALLLRSSQPRRFRTGWAWVKLPLLPLPREGKNKPVSESKGAQLQGKWICAGLLVNSLMCLLR